eukprot:TRINITY_DN4158_c0_g1_i2.p1 TRINITY_DN4158_c0_g1~~TRINITY_DN4158_c0_g1_i2.p1  ORF type:complete len:848 (+),score=329.88 TRINITY_DN4158_c0_g1_i2:177-2720(+)
MNPHPCQNVPACFFGVSAAEAGSQPHNFVLATPANYTLEHCGLPTSHEAHVPARSVERLQALPGIKSLTLTGQYPIADVAYDVTGLPVELSLEAASPLIPGEAQNSAFPAAVFTFTAKNATDKQVSVRLLQGQQNFVGWDGVADATAASTPFLGGNVNTPFAASGLSGISMSSTSTTTQDMFKGTLCLAAVEGDAVAREDDDWDVVGDGASDAKPAEDEVTGKVIMQAASEEALWGAFVGGQEVPAAAAAATSPSAAGASYCCGVVQGMTLAPGESKSVSFVLSWHFPNRQLIDGANKWTDRLPLNIGNRYGVWYSDAKAVATALRGNLSYLLAATRAYRDAVYGSTIPENFVMSAAGRASIVGSTSMWWSRDGIILGWEGNHCCPLNCSHVYGYGVLLERLFPEVAKDMLFSWFSRTYDPATGVTMRYGHNGFAIDGALACVIKAYLAVQQADGDVSWLPSIWENVKGQIEIMFTRWDVDGDGCIRDWQQNTYDTAMHGANTFIGSYYVTALRAASKMAELMKDADFAKQCADRAALASASYEKICWKEEYGYYVADVTAKDCAHSYGPGCFIDQLCASGLSFACGLGYMFNAEHETSARLAIAKNNTVQCPPFHDLQKHMFPGDTGTTTCTYPHGKLGKGMIYDTLVSIGWTYPVIAGLLHDKRIDEATYMNDIIRQRQDGRNRSPWNEPECDTHYTRMFSGWGLYDQACGMRYDATQKAVGFEPRFNSENFNCFVAMEGGWGTFTQAAGPAFNSGTVTLKSLHGTCSVKTLGVYSFTKPDACTADLDGAAVAATLTDVPGLGMTVGLGDGVAVKQGSTLTVRLRTSVARHVDASQPCCGSQGCC